MNPPVAAPALATALASFPADGIAVVFGAGGGIGGALLARLRAEPAFQAAIGFGRTTLPPIDLEDEASLARAVAQAAEVGPLRLVIDATGFLHDARQRPERSWRDLDAAALARAFAINATGPALIMKHVLPRLPRTGKAVFATLSARVGSIGDNRLGGWYGYRASKAALNQIVRTAAIEQRRRWAEALRVALHPGTVETPLSSPFARDRLMIQTPSEAAARLLGVIDALGPGESGGFFDHYGAVIPW
ncbi:SDR family oxidoreductase [Sabulicella glaciei]|uniref:SDR family oxidoreductase n=1 Tax=Sabulicella glaciei TaxID=2984948 RepID=A0ABT3P269_9PROT|nr:SDR family oxidoreductase [Roseococcus sp. MDT2-1-1]MCW8088513.1 SDR family oxidoreductase [Roseococcus sp. MDT2-1-1]